MFAMSSPVDRVAVLRPEERARLLDRLQRRMAAVASQDAIPRCQRDGPVPVSFAQQRLWFLDQLAPGNPTYNIPYYLRLEGRLEVRELTAALHEVVHRHEVLRTTFEIVDDDPMQVIAPGLVIAVSMIDLSDLPPAVRETQLSERCTAEVSRPFDLEQGPLLRMTLVRLTAAEHALLLTMHHIVSDGWSIGVLAQELSALYPAFLAGRPSPLPVLPIQYADFSQWQRRRLHGSFQERQLDYWRRQLDDLPVLELPGDRPRPAIGTFRGDLVRRPLSRRLLEELKELGETHDATPFMTLLAAYAVLLQRRVRRAPIGD